MKRDTSGQVSTSHLACLVSASASLSYDVLMCWIEVALEREVEGDLFLQDIGQGFGFRPGSFDGAIRYERHTPPTRT